MRTNENLNGPKSIWACVFVAVHPPIAPDTNESEHTHNFPPSICIYIGRVEEF